MLLGSVSDLLTAQGRLAASRSVKQRSWVLLCVPWLLWRLYRKQKQNPAAPLSSSSPSDLSVHGAMIVSWLGDPRVKVRLCMALYLWCGFFFVFFFWGGGIGWTAHEANWCREISLDLKKLILRWFWTLQLSRNGATHRCHATCMVQDVFRATYQLPLNLTVEACSISVALIVQKIAEAKWGLVTSIERKKKSLGDDSQLCCW